MTMLPSVSSDGSKGKGGRVGGIVLEKILLVRCGLIRGSFYSSWVSQAIL